MRQKSERSRARVVGGRCVRTFTRKHVLWQLHVCKHMLQVDSGAANCITSTVAYARENYGVTGLSGVVVAWWQAVAQRVCGKPAQRRF